MRCPGCDAAELSAFFQQKTVPVLCNVLWPTREEARQAPVGRIRLGFCPGCGLIYNTAFDPALITYTQAYENSLHFSPRFHAYAEQLAGDLIRRYALRGKRVIDVGCGKGDFLRLLCELGDNQGLGFDASYEGGNGDGNGSFRVIRDYYSEAHAHHTADLICCRHVLEHIPDPRQFLARIHKAAAGNRGAAIFFEVPNALYTLRDLGIWDVIYEHCSYFSEPALRRVFADTGFDPRRSYATFGEQFLCLEAAMADDASAPSAPPREALDELAGLVQAFAAHFQEKVERWNTRLDGMLAEGRRVAIWGAGSKGVSFLNTLEAGGKVTCAVDINTRKQGRFIPGSAQQVVPPHELRDLGVDAVLVMNPLYTDEIRGQLDDLGVRASLDVV